MADKKTYLMYKTWNPMLKALDNESLGKLMKSILELQDGNIKMPDDPILDAVFYMIKGVMDGDEQKYSETCEKRSKAASVRYKDANVCNSTQVNANASDNDNDNENDNDLLKKENKEKRQLFIPPTIEEAQAYISEKGYKVDAERFVDFYTSKGWMVGKNKMKDWKSAIRNWSRQDVSGYQPKKESKGRKYDFDALEQELL